MINSKFILAADIGGTHITSAVVSTADWSIIPATEARHSVASAEDAKSIFQDWKTALSSSLSQFKNSESKGQISSLGIAMPGPFDYSKGISYMQGQGKYDSLYGIAILDRLQEALNLPGLTIHFINDAAAFLQGEIFTQQLNHTDRVLGITLGTGLGSASWQRGQKAQDAALWDSPYKGGIFEEYLTTRWFTSTFEKQTGIRCSGLKEILQEQHAHPYLPELLENYSLHLTDFLAFFAAREQCTRFVIGGNIGKIIPQLIKANEKAFSPYQLYSSQLAEKAAIIGASTIFEESFDR